jgi:proteasome lid subunit RPN8/RPN11
MYDNANDHPRPESRMHICRDILQAIAVHARQTAPEECCGLLLGRPGAILVEQSIPSSNVADPTTRRSRYTLDPRLILETQKACSATGMEILGVYHSHPDHPAVPSITDATLSWEGLAYLIVHVDTRTGASQETRAWRFESQKPVEEPLVIVDSPSTA